MHDTASVQQHWAFVKPHRVSNRGGRRHQNEDWTEQRAEKRWMVIQLILVTKVTPVLTAELVDISIQEKEAEKPGSEGRFCRRLLQRQGSIEYREQRTVRRMYPFHRSIGEDGFQPFSYYSATHLKATVASTAAP